MSIRSGIVACMPVAKSTTRLVVAVLPVIAFLAGCETTE